ncbi:dehydrogenase [Sulfolobus sp. A20]|uniref:NAD(P)/FAD-dependent oxidoreductase n=1 Tax=Sulfolobaceae TaxID=118883 RepID=UPI0008461E28|nr:MULTISPECIES: NAD(P)/FAD-dependent oxidoreductase [unclassified Sulfolobus]TRM78255.1 NAD(P)/FAD-dependent oxidoreductase [Sulfolobus sp. A20-N-F8]TRM78925.1 NAD(P)/FAD-dependent oxidoreductase [Sulfolobus sp. B5]TRM85448.1 NAD(P)/FAD-dependent oxidoreductase [Sulfolobus sp. F3]TRM88500.1 NAD(P)/FAD-dependent oxidoreductase [Sulfolobus sp. C3]TRM99628.1 NAD(P)/FAD-dependent oxidoreductase [Sulfolobus sp. F1]
MRVAIIGGGVAGSTLAYLLSKKANHEVTIFDINEKYVKPCGDIVPNIYTPPFNWEVKFNIKRFSFRIDGERIYDVEYSHTKWLVIDKWNWINSMRKHAKIVVSHEALKEKFDYVIDSRGPYPLDRQVVYTTRAIIETKSFDDKAVIEFNTKYTGFYWIFPSGENEYNVGAGFLEYKNSKSLLNEYLRERFKDYRIKDVRGAPISIGIPSIKKGRVGEARGLVFPLSGEGIRPSAISAEYAFEAIHKGKELDDYLDDKLKIFEKRINIQLMLLNIYKYSSISLRRTLMKTFFKNDVLIDAYLEDKIDLDGIVESIKSVKGNGYISREF